MDTSRLMSKEIKTGDSARVRPGVKYPDYDYDISGWQGRVTHIGIDEGKFIEIAWDIVTLDQMPAGLIETSMEEGLDTPVLKNSISIEYKFLTVKTCQYLRKIWTGFTFIFQSTSNILVC